MSVKKYNVKTDGAKKLSADFSVNEFRCNDGSDIVLIDSNLVLILQKIRSHFGKSVAINSAYRTISYNAKVGGVAGSQHTKGTAADITVSGITPLEAAQYAEYIMPNKGGIGLYSSFTHIDVRKNKSRWKNFGTEVTVSGFPGFVKKELATANDIIWELAQRIEISDTNAAVQALEKERQTNSSLYWLLNKTANRTPFKTGAKNISSANDIIWELAHKISISDINSAVKELDKAKAQNSSLYWICNKLVNS